MNRGDGRPIRSTDLWARVAETTRLALASGALQPIETAGTIIEDGGIRFVVREISSLLRKFSEQAKAGPSRNPFSPFEPALHVGDLSEGHVVLLNKFPLMADHLLVITRGFVPQDTLIGIEDFVGLASAMGERPCLAFYNAGSTAGASQPHRHLQLVPLPFEGAEEGTPIEPVLARARGRNGAGVAGLGYHHALAWLDPSPFADPIGPALNARRVSGAVDRGRDRGDVLAGRRAAIQTLQSPRHPRVDAPDPAPREHYETISVNALGFAGSLFVKDAAQARRRAPGRAANRAGRGDARGGAGPGHAAGRWRPGQGFT